MDDNASKALYLGFSVLMSVFVLTIALGFFYKGRDLMALFSKDQDRFISYSENRKYLQYDETIVQGSDVLNSIREFADSSFTITVKTKLNPTGVTYSSYNSYKIVDINNKDYIEPIVKFTSTLTKNTNGAVDGIIFEAK